MTVHPVHHIVIETGRRPPRLKVRAFDELEITSGRRRITDRLRLRLPTLKDLNLLREGDRITVSLGNEHTGLHPVFDGWITRISPTGEPVVEAEDSLQRARNARIHRTWDRVNASQIAAEVLQEAGLLGVIPGGENLGDRPLRLVADGHTAEQVLVNIAAQTGWDFFTLPGETRVYVGPPFPYSRGILPQTVIPRFRFGFNILKADLAYRDREHVGKIRVYVVDIKFRGEGFVVEYPEDGEGPVKTYTLQMDFDPDNPESRNGARGQAVKFAMEKYAELQQSGFSGWFTALLDARLKHSMKIMIEDPAHPERSGHYEVEEITYRVSADGYLMDVNILGSREETRGYR
ncbi:MAG: hypothetical protein L3J76_00690 [Candidatus Hydrothermae bacterium]|nr:hypothetical protein [Candidatus Hydrothermae bacterium]